MTEPVYLFPGVFYPKYLLSSLLWSVHCFQVKNNKDESLRRPFSSKMLLQLPDVPFLHLCLKMFQETRCKPFSFFSHTACVRRVSLLNEMSTGWNGSQWLRSEREAHSGMLLHIMSHLCSRAVTGGKIICDCEMVLNFRWQNRSRRWSVEAILSAREVAQGDVSHY